MRSVLSAALVISMCGIASAQTLYGVARDDNLLRVIDQSDGSTISSIVMSTGAGDVPSGLTGLAADPTSGLLYGLFKFGGPRTLGTVDPDTGLVTMLGSTGDSFAGIAFDNSGQLYGVTGDGADDSETLFSIDKTDGSTSFLLSLGEGDDGETIGYNNDNGLMYHASGIDTDEKVWEAIDLSIPGVVSSIILDEDPPEEILAFTYAGSGDFFMSDRTSGSDGESGFFRIDIGGHPTLLGDMGFSAKGLALVPPVPAPGSLLVMAGGFALAHRRRR